MLKIMVKLFVAKRNTGEMLVARVVCLMMLYSVFLPEAVLRLLQAIFVDYSWSIAILFVAVVCFLFGLLILLLDENPISLRIMKLDVI